MNNDSHHLDNDREMQKTLIASASMVRIERFQANANSFRRSFWKCRHSVTPQLSFAALPRGGIIVSIRYQVNRMTILVEALKSPHWLVGSLRQQLDVGCLPEDSTLEDVDKRICGACRRRERLHRNREAHILLVSGEISNISQG